MALKDLIPGALRRPQRTVRISPDLATTNELLSRLCTAVERLADVYAPIPEPITAAQLAEYNERDDNVDEETLAVIDIIESSGRRVPDEVYRHLKIDPPDRELPDDPTPWFGEPQPGYNAGKDEEMTYPVDPEEISDSVQPSVPISRKPNL